MKRALIALLFLVLSAASQTVHAGIPVTCTNCSQAVRQMLDSITMANELTTVIEQYNQMIIQTEQQLFMAKSELERLIALPQTTMQQFSDSFTNLAGLVNQVNMYKGDMSALADIYRAAYPDLNETYGLAQSDDREALQKQWQKRQEQSDELSKNAFMLSSAQLSELAKNQDALKRHIDGLLTQQNETGIAQAANKLASLSIKELQDLKSLAAMSLQQQSDQALKAAKEEQEGKAIHDELFKARTTRFEPPSPMPF